MLYALNLHPETKRVLSVTEDQYGPAWQPRVTEFPQDNITNYLYINEEFIYDPLPEPEYKPDPIKALQSEMAELKSQNEMLTECLLEVSEEIYN